MSPALEIANAKLTVHLHVTGVRPDGYHFLDSEMVSLDLADTLLFSDGDGIELEGEAEGVPAGPDNLVIKALQASGMRAHVVITKRIPVRGGLGGGSSNAAAALRWAQSLDMAAAARIGADVPFCVRGGRARVRGIGDHVEALPFEERTFTLLVPPFGVNTAAVYEAFDQLNDSFDRHAVNDLEEAAIAVEPRLTEWRDKMTAWTGHSPTLAGSGSTWFVEGAHEEPPQNELLGARWIVARTVPAH